MACITTSCRFDDKEICFAIGCEVNSLAGRGVVEQPTKAVNANPYSRVENREGIMFISGMFGEELSAARRTSNLMQAEYVPGRRRVLYPRQSFSPIHFDSHIAMCASN